ncbi:GtrA family protein [Paucibacter sediminis]|uniref:GtrA family protein n=1 Tax=Paucibacter sediminis TaxID=3019553 RepID=A0AA95NAB4_9BURK|nr:GtrA family protein [Paucibacter sp. S2-9]WIT11322.1 GtrA family protein [Paucibacter sp. S2-9]
MKVAGQFVRYVIVGLLSNGLSYALYLAATALGVQPVVAMTVLYGVATLQTFAANRQWTFKDGGRSHPALVRYVVLYALGYGLNLVLLMVGVDLMRWPHQWVMAGVIVCVAVFLFAGQKLWVFRSQGAGVRAA